MVKDTHASHAISLAGNKSEYNAHAINILSDLHILAYILKGTIPEYENMSVFEIISTIDGTPEIQSIPVHVREVLNGDKNDDVVPNEGTTRFDIRFHVYIPFKGEKVKLLINLEAQQDFNPHYDLVTRSIYYGARMISSQHGTEFINDNYNDIKNIYSIWICTDVPNYAKNTITQYKIHQEKVLGDFKRKHRYDILNIVFLCLGDTTQEDLPQYLNMLTVALGNHIDVEEKKRRLKNEFEIPMTIEFEREINEMCNLADAIERQGIEQGIEQGIIAMVETLRELDQSDERIAEKLKEKFNLKENEIKKYL